MIRNTPMEPEFLSCSNLLKNFNDANPPNDKIFNLGGVCGVKVLTGIFGFTFFRNQTDRLDETLGSPLFNLPEH